MKRLLGWKRDMGSRGGELSRGGVGSCFSLLWPVHGTRSKFMTFMNCGVRRVVLSLDPGIASFLFIIRGDFVVNSYAQLCIFIEVSGLCHADKSSFEPFF